MKSYLASLAVMVLALSAAPARAQDQPGAPAQSSDGPVELQKGVARVSFIHGDVSSQRGDSDDWTAVTLNTPVAAGDRVAVGQKSRAELQLDWADILRMSDSATAKVTTLDRTHVQVQVGQGLVTYNVLKGSEADTEIDTPNAAIHPLGPGEYRILVNSDAETQVIVRKGSAEVSEPQGTTRIEEGQMITVAGTDNPQYKTDSAPGKDDWDKWNNDRDHRINTAESWRKTNHYYTGSEDLDSYGVWSEVPDYGPVWVPAVNPGWAPYRTGRWCWEPDYGWTWVSDEPWGWAPYHYGRWFVYGGSWVWWPGPVAVYPGYYPIWAPAYVSFFGFGGGGWDVGFGFGFGGFGWLPCGPGDWYHPWYGRWGNRGNFVNVTNNYRDGFRPLGGERAHPYSNLNGALSDPRVRSGMSSMGGNEFGRGAVSPHQQPVSEVSFRKASLMTGKMPVSPSRESFSPSGRSANPSAVRNVPPASQRFFSPASRTNGAANSPGSRSFATPNNTGRGGSTFGGSRGPAQGAPQSSRPGWRAFTPPSSAGANRQAQNSGAGNGAAPNSPARGTFSSPAGQPSRNAGAPPSRAGYSNSAPRPPLNMRQPIVTPRGGESYSRGSNGAAPYGGSSAPRSSGGSAPRGGSSAPRGGGNGGSGNRGGGGGGNRSGGGRSR
jgi:FecR protein